MKYRSQSSYLEITEAAMVKLEELIKLSEYRDPVIIFYASSPKLTSAATSPDDLTSSEIDEFKGAISSGDFLEQADIHVDAAPRSSFPKEAIVEISGLPINAPSLPGAEGKLLMTMDYIAGRFSLTAIKGP